jgi:hypothetical protein
LTPRGAVSRLPASALVWAGMCFYSYYAGGQLASEPGALNPVTVHSRCLGKGSYRPWIANSAGDLPVRHINFRILLCRARIRIHCGRELHNPGALPCLSGMGYSFILRTTGLTTPQYRTLCVRYCCLLDFLVTCQPERSGKVLKKMLGWIRHFTV